MYRKVTESFGYTSYFYHMKCCLSTRKYISDKLFYGLKAVYNSNPIMKTKIDHPKRNPQFVTGAYSDAIVANGFVFVSGQAAVDFGSSRFILGSIEAETKLTLDNIKAILEASGSSLQNVVKCTVHLANINDFDRYNAVYSEYFPGIKPSRTTVQSVLAEGIKVEIDCIAKLSNNEN